MAFARKVRNLADNDRIDYPHHPAQHAGRISPMASTTSMRWRDYLDSLTARAALTAPA
jgi:hypothetical protein